MQLSSHRMKQILIPILSAVLSHTAFSADSIIDATQNKDAHLAITLSGTASPAQQSDYVPGEIPLVRLFDTQTKKTVGLSVFLDGTVDAHNMIKDRWEGWTALWNPSNQFVVLLAPRKKKKDESPRQACFYFQVSKDGLHKVEIPNLEPFLSQMVDEGETVRIETVKPMEWVTGDRLYVQIEGSYSAGTEAPDFKACALLKFYSDGNITVDALFDVRHP